LQQKKKNQQSAGGARKAMLPLAVAEGSRSSRLNQGAETACTDGKTSMIEFQKSCPGATSTVSTLRGGC
jgi:hypothetical protein